MASLIGYTGAFLPSAGNYGFVDQVVDLIAGEFARYLREVDGRIRGFCHIPASLTPSKNVNLASITAKAADRTFFVAAGSVRIIRLMMSIIASA